MALLFDRTSIGREDRAAHFTTEVGGVVVVADGAGGTGRGALAAEAAAFVEELSGAFRLGLAAPAASGPAAVGVVDLNDPGAAARLKARVTVLFTISG